MQRTARRSAGLALLVLAAIAPSLPVAAASPTHWSAAHRLSSGQYAEPQVAINAAGAAIAVWQVQRAHGSGRVAAVATRDAGQGWSATRRLTVAGRASEAIFAGIGGSGRDVIVWAAQPVAGGATHILWSQRRPHRAWTTPVAVPGQSVVPDSFFLSTSGWGVIAYESHGVGYIRVLTPAGRWRSAQRVTALVPKVHHDAVGTSTNVRAVISSTGAVSAAWAAITVDTRSRTAGNYERGGLTISGKRLTPAVLATNLNANDGAIRLVASPSGNSVAIKWNNADNHDTVAFRLAGNRWLRHVAPIDNGPSGSAASASTVALSDHRVALWWQSWTSTVATLYETTYDGTGWTEPAALVHYDATGPTSFADDGDISDWVQVVGWTQFQVTTPEPRHDSTVRTTSSTGGDELNLGPRSVVRDVAVAGRHAAVTWIGPGGLYVQTR